MPGRAHDGNAADDRSGVGVVKGRSAGQSVRAHLHLGRAGRLGPAGASGRQTDQPKTGTTTFLVVLTSRVVVTLLVVVMCLPSTTWLNDMANLAIA